ncbi:MAG: 4'-phosphopantetheinyl transferase superfamily protein [Desulfobulbaceae bacterium]|nr:MAG: 4'-phosphopantetheinyl transferase superfamily protein [Desulfobulbaceae bacterium]
MSNNLTAAQLPDLAPPTFLKHLATRPYSECPTLTQLHTDQMVNGDESTFEQTWLTEPEKLQLKQYGFDKRRREWLSGRICAKKAAMQYLARATTAPLAALDLSIQSDQSGRPYLISHNPQIAIGELDISISHSHDMAVGIAGSNYCGVDLQYLNNTLFKVKNRYCSDFESLILDELPADELLSLGLLWVAKEAVRKCLSSIRLIGFREMELIGVAEKDGIYTLLLSSALSGISISNVASIEVVAHTVGDYALGLCSIAKEKIHA